ncbi:4'-phosphopantetheinyl transferase family protein [Streptomyces drozdowiczii]|uniref:4'-phosphopantetheinyl transferase superfamily protein n=1 Tax=Streptomyces drozdowiczii TaxID=202862 RepID=A0ABY6Q3G1_9ACTN|nr:4'-phosphopantetheinyl transferase superfamily protein [Streptomyces drozdowiczii]MCX0241768.1 4'-phosphopantetheinyl transferase superfamily protein [Streptomyces drozdowiczii]UZK58705.1 4'-phosphopantetheinyl transferase superfamily protein [Streptomyces drozdowiczii]
MTIGDPLAVTVAGTNWAAVRTELAAHGTALVHGRLDDWRPADPGGASLRATLGRDWARYRDITHEEIRDQFAASRLLLKHAAAAALHAEPQDLELMYGPTGRPYLRGCDQIDISLSHTDDLLLVGLTTRGLVGVDAERSDRRIYSRGLDRHICTPHERLLVSELPEEERNPSLLRLWTLKEAYSKAIGQGMRFRFTEFGFGPDGRPTQVHRPDGTPGAGDEWSFRTCLLVSDGLEFCVSAAVYDAGLGRTADAQITTMLDTDAVAALTEALEGEWSHDYWSQFLDH